MQIMRLFNEEAGKNYLKEKGVSAEIIQKLELMGISGISNMLAAVKTAKYYELTENDIIFTVFTDSIEMYQSRLSEASAKSGKYTHENAAVDYHHHLNGCQTDNLLELSYAERRRIHNLKYFTWIEQQGKDVEELNAQWYGRDYWTSRFGMASQYDEMITKFNKDMVNL